VGDKKWQLGDITKPQTVTKQVTSTKGIDYGHHAQIQPTQAEETGEEDEEEDCVETS
jgi:hypothetical protein